MTDNTDLFHDAAKLLQEGVVFLVKRGDALMQTLPADKRASVALYLADELATSGDRLERTSNFAFAMHGIDYDPPDAA